MARSKSGTIRRSLGLRKQRLVTLHEEATQFYNAAAPADHGAVDEQLFEIEVIISKLTSAINAIQECDKQWRELIAQLTDDDECDAEEMLYGTNATDEGGFIGLIDSCNEIIGLLRLKIARLAPAPAAPAGAAAVVFPNHVDLDDSTVSNRGTKKTAKLPKLTLPVFNGDPLTWSEFYSIFKTNIDDSDLEGAEKLTYLRSQLRGTALEAVEGLEITDVSYEVAMGILKERFERSPEQLVSSLYSQLKRLPRSSGRVEDLRRTYDGCEKIFRQLKAAGEDIDSNRSLTMDVWSKYPVHTVKELARRNANTHSKLCEIQVALKKYIDETDDLRDMLGDLEPFGKETSSSGKSSTQSRDRQYSNSNRYDQKPYQKINRYDSGWSKRDSTAETPSSTLSTTERPKSLRSDGKVNSPKFPCCFCGELHFNSECVNYKTRQQRMARLGEVNRCQHCLGNRHQTSECDAGDDRIRCYYCRSFGVHISALCPKEFGRPGSNSKDKSVTLTTDSVKPKRSGATTSCALNFDEQSLLSTAVTTIVNPETGERHRAKIILDSGSHRSYITEKLSNSLGLKTINNETLNVAVFGTSRSLIVSSSQVQIEIGLKNGKTVPIMAHTTPTITNCSLTPENFPASISKLVESIRHAMADDMSLDGPPDVLLGSDYFWEFVTGTRMRTDDGIFVIPSSLGLILGGRYKGDPDSSNLPTLLCLTERTGATTIDTSLALVSTESRAKQPYPDVDDFWMLEKIGISDDPVENDDEIALKSFNDSIYFDNGRYNVQWPWKANNDQLPANYQLALGRLRSLAKRLLAADDSLPLEYNNVIKTQIELGIIEQVPDDEIIATKNRVHYLPHHPVVKIDRATTKVRIVYDASAKCRRDQVSLNECMYRGPVLLPDLCSILLRFRLPPVAIIADIEKAFLQISLDPSQRDVTRFLWFRDPKKLDVNDVVVFRFARVPFGVISSPFILGATVQHHLKLDGSKTADLICNNIYVDNVICGSASDDDAIKFYDEAKSIFRKASMNLREWCSNSNELLNHIPAEDNVGKRTTKVLGLKWDSEADTLQLNVNWSNRLNCRTKREVLKATASIYDPLGLFQPCTLRLKIFLRELWNNNANWDDAIEEKFREKWTLLHTEISPIFDIQIPRHINRSENSSLVVFTDASAEAYAVAVYLRNRNDSKPYNWTTSLIYAKSRLSPKTNSKSDISIPKLELLGLTIGAKAAEFVKKSLDDGSSMKTYVLSDSMCALGWLQGTKPLPVFVSNRVRDIKNLKNAEFRHVNGVENPADLCTRGVSGGALKISKLWWFGPEWLQLDDSNWSTKSNFEAITDVELKKIDLKPMTQPVYHTFLVGEGACERKRDSFPFDMDPRKFSSFRRLVRVTCWCLKFLRRKVFDKLTPELQALKPSWKRTFDEISVETIITAAELREAKKMWISHIQHNEYADVFDAIRTKKAHALVKQLNLGIDKDGILRSYGRLTLADLPDESIEPMLLPYDDFVTHLIVNDAHCKLLHSGVNHTLSQVRREFWIPRGRNAVRKVITKCVLCRKNKGPPFALPSMPPWPKERVSRSTPFQYTGVDYFGPVNVTMNDVPKKMWVCLFTCLTVRAVHLEPVLDCTAEAFLNTISRFIARRGAPEQIISDNAPQFRLAKTLFDRTWHKVLRDDAVQSYISDNGIRWKFTTELAPWMGGVYERLVGLVKNTYKNAVGRKLLKHEEFITLIAEVESIVNSRPITYVYSDSSSGLALRPVDFLTDLCTGTPSIDPTIRPEGGDAAKNLVRHWKAKQRRLDIIWKQWYDDYLLSMRERGGTSHKGGRSEIRSSIPVVNEVVTVKNPDAPRGNWKLGRITKVIIGNDGSVRSAELVLPNGQVLRRSINHLYRLEIPTVVDPALIEPEKSADERADDESFDGFSDEEIDAARRLRMVADLFCGRMRKDENTSTIALVECARAQILSGLTNTAVPLSFETAKRH